MFIRESFFIILLFIVSMNSLGQTDTLDRTYWLKRYLNVSYPLRSISINSSYGNRKDPFTKKMSIHGGIDIQAQYEDILAMFDGKVVHTGYDNRSGYYITIQHGKYTISYCHLSKVYLQVGDNVLAGDVVGVSGNTGRSTGPHLHITAKCDGKTINPYNLLLYVKRVRQEAFLALGGEYVSHSSPEDFIARYAPAAIEQQQKYGIPASVTLAQMACESSWGGSELSRVCNNYFGIKAHDKYLQSGHYAVYSDDNPNDKFCKYESVNESLSDHSLLLMSDRYKACRQYASTDYEHWIKGIKAAGYATDPRYVSTLISQALKSLRMCVHETC